MPVANAPTASPAACGPMPLPRLGTRVPVCGLHAGVCVCAYTSMHPHGGAPMHRIRPRFHSIPRIHTQAFCKDESTGRFIVKYFLDSQKPAYSAYSSYTAYILARYMRVPEYTRMPRILSTGMLGMRTYAAHDSVRGGKFQGKGSACVFSRIGTIIRVVFRGQGRWSAIGAPLSPMQRGGDRRSGVPQAAGMWTGGSLVPDSPAKRR